MTETLDTGLAELAGLLTDRQRLVRAIGSGRRRGRPAPEHPRVEVRPVELSGGLKLQISYAEGPRPTVHNLDFTADTIDALLQLPYGNWRVETTDATVQLRVTKRGEALVHRAGAERTRDLAHDRTPPHLIDADDPLFTALGAGAAKRRQVDAFLRAVTPLLPDGDRPLRLADLGCGNAYLTFAMYRYLARRGRAATVTGVDIRDDQRRRNTALAEVLGCSGDVRFVAAGIADADLDGTDVALALHACDTATDDAIARGVRLGADRIFAAPCCHHDIAAQLREGGAPEPYRALTGDGILRERFADVLTDTLRAMLLRSHGYKVDVIEFVDSAHTPRNTLIRAVRTGAGPDPRLRAEYDAIVTQWNIRPYLDRLLTA